VFDTINTRVGLAQIFMNKDTLAQDLLPTGWSSEGIAETIMNASPENIKHVPRVPGLDHALYRVFEIEEEEKLRKDRDLFKS
jgi:uncharacterized protein Smg (DUF494 family)